MYTNREAEPFSSRAPAGCRARRAATGSPRGVRAVSQRDDRGGGAPAVEAGLCSGCIHAQSLRSRRSTFLRCRRSDVDATFPRYPRLPVLACVGFEPQPPRAAPTGD